MITTIAVAATIMCGALANCVSLPQSSPSATGISRTDRNRTFGQALAAPKQQAA